MDAVAISYILPFYKKLGLLHAALPANAAIFGATRSELVIVLDEPESLDAVETLCRGYLDSIRTRILVTDEPHAWRPPCRAINAGVRHARGEYVAVLSPETVVALPTPSYLETRVKPVHFLCGLLWTIQNVYDYAPPDRVAAAVGRARNLTSPSNFGFGFFLCPKSAFERVNGMDESRGRYGRDDDCIRFRLVRSGLLMVIDPHIEIFHPAHASDSDRNMNTTEPIQPCTILNQPNWGRSGFRVACDWIK